VSFIYRGFFEAAFTRFQVHVTLAGASLVPEKSEMQ
jgi:hypothetical protein